MSYQTAIQVEGLNDYVAALRSYSVQIGNKVALRALRLGADNLRTAISAAAPIYTGKPKKKLVVGLLKAGFRAYQSKIHTGKDSDMIGVYVGFVRGKKRPFYGSFLEHGWNPKGDKVVSRAAQKSAMSAYGMNTHRSGRKTMPSNRTILPQRFIQNTVNAKQSEIENIVSTALEYGLESLAREVGLK